MKTFTSFFVAIAAIFIFSNTAFGQISYVTGSPQTATAGATTTLTIPKPSDLAVGDVMIATITQGDDGDNQTLGNATRTGWGLVRGAQLGDNGNSSWWGTVLYRVADAADVAAASFAFTLDADVEASVGGIIALRGVSAAGVLPDGTGSGPFDVAAGTMQVTDLGATTATVTAPGITTVTAGAGVIMLAMGGDNNSFSPSWTTTSPGGLTEVLDVNSNTNPDEVVGAALASKPTAGATGNGTVIMSGTDHNGGVLIALRPTVAGPVVVNAGPDQVITLPTNSVTLDGSLTTGAATRQWTKISGPALPEIITTPGSLSSPVNNLTQGVYVFRLTCNGLFTDDVQITVNAGIGALNLFAAQGTGQVVGFAVGGNGAVINGPTNVFDPYPSTGESTAALGRDANNVFYYLTNDGPNGQCDLYAYNPATLQYATLATNFDVNGGSGNALGFVRLAISPTGVGWILAGDGTTLYLASFPANGTAATTITVVDNSVSMSGGTATPATFASGDLAFTANGTMFALGNSGGETVIYTMTNFTGTSTLNFRLNLLDNAGAPFTGTVNGVAFDLSGNAFISTGIGLFFIDQNTVDNVTGTVNCQVRWLGAGLTDLATNLYPEQSSLPVKLTFFNVNKQGSDAIVKWTTEKEINNDHFEIERSTDGIQFTKVGTVAGNGTTNASNNYQFTDPLAGITSKIVYYRLRDVDIAGKGTYSKIVALRLDGSRGIKNFAVYPNPFTSNIKINISSEGESNVTLNVNSMNGQQILSRKAKLQAGDNIVVIDNLSTLKKGVYILELITPETRMIQKLVRH